MYALRWKVFLVMCMLYSRKGTPCTMCNFINQTTNLSNCTERCGGGTRYYFHYVCCGNFSKSECETHCNLNLSNTRSLKVLVGCNTFCNNGGTFQNDTVGSGMCLCPSGTTGRCCDMYTNSTHSTVEHMRKPSPARKNTLYMAVGVPLGVILIAAVVSVIFYAWLQKRSHRVDMTENEFN